MWIFLLALIIGLLIGLFTNVNIPNAYYPYITLVILASIDALIAGVRSKNNKTYSNQYFVLAWLSNVAFVILFKALGDALGVDLAVALIVFLGMRIFYNFSKLRRTWFNKLKRRRNLLKVWSEEQDIEDTAVEDVNVENKRQEEAERLRNQARNLRIKADDLVSQADALEEKEALEQLEQTNAKQKAEAEAKAKAKQAEKQKKAERKQEKRDNKRSKEK